MFNRSDSSYQHIEWIQKKHPNELYAKVCNRWVSLFTVSKDKKKILVGNVGQSENDRTFSVKWTKVENC